MFKKVKTSKNLAHNQVVGYKNKLSYRDRLKNANATDFEDNSITKDWGNGFSSLMPKKNKRI